MAHPAHKIAGPMFRTFDIETRKARAPATHNEVEAAFTTPVGLRAPRCIVDEWVNEARRRNGIPSTSALVGRRFRAEQELRKHPKPKKAPVRLSKLQSLARRITRLFRKH